MLLFSKGIQSCAHVLGRSISSGISLIGQGQDPARVVVVCMTGYPFGEFKCKNILRLEDVESKARLHGEESKISVENFEKLHLGGGSSGMEDLRKKLVAELRSLNVPENNIMLKPWTEGSESDPNSQPVYNRLARTINEIRPLSVCIIGHSYGGWAACRLSRKLNTVPSYIALFDPMFSYKSRRRDREPYFEIVSGSQKDHIDNYPKGQEIRSWYQTHRYDFPYGRRDVRKDGGAFVRNEEAQGRNHWDIDDDGRLHAIVIDEIKAVIKRDLHLQSSKVNRLA